MSDFPRMIYRVGSDAEIHGVMCDYTIVEHNDDLGLALAEGWSLTPSDAAVYAEMTKPKPQVEALDAPPTRTELERKATELGIVFDGRTNDAKLAAKIASKVKE